MMLTEISRLRITDVILSKSGIQESAADAKSSRMNRTGIFRRRSGLSSAEAQSTWRTWVYAENRKRYPEYRQAKAKMIELLTTKNNVERILGVTEKEKKRDRQQEAR